MSYVASFIENHPRFSFGADVYKRALLNVGDVRSIRVSVSGEMLDVDVEIEPRDKFTEVSSQFLLYCA